MGELHASRMQDFYVVGAGRAGTTSLNGICLSRPFATTFPREARWVSAAWLAWCVAAAIGWRWLPAPLPVFAAAVALVWAAVIGLDWWTCRDSQGTPPGRLSVVDGIRALIDRGYYLRNFEIRGPIFNMSQFGAPTIGVLALDRIERLIKGQAGSLRPSTLPISNGVEENFLRYMPPETHGVYGRLFQRAMSGPFPDSQAGPVAGICRRQFRLLAQEFEFEGHWFPRGWLLRGSVWESHRTSAVIAEPGQFRLREEPLAYDRRHFIPLGMGAHTCNGSDIHELICLTFLEPLHRASSVRVLHGEPLQRQTRHWVIGSRTWRCGSP